MTIVHASVLLPGVNNNSQPATSSGSEANIGDIDGANNSSLWGSIGFRTNTANSFQEIDITAQTEFWVGFNHYTLPSNNNFVGYVCTWKLAAGSSFVGLYANPAVPKLGHWNGSVWTELAGQVHTKYNVGFTGGDTEISTTVSRFDIHIKIHETEGFIRVYRSNILMTTFTGNTLFLGINAVECIRFYHGSLIQTTVSQFLVSTTRTIGIKLKSLLPNGVGAQTQFTSGAWTAVDEVVVIPATVDSDFIESLTTGQEFCVNLNPLTNFTYGVHAVAMNFRANSAAGSPEAANAYLRVGGVNYHGPDRSLTTTYTGYKQVWDNNPATGLPWAIADIANLEAGVRSRS